MLQDEGIHDPATWLNLPLSDPYVDDVPSRATKKEIYMAGGIIDLLSYAKKYIPHDELMSRTSLHPDTGASRSRVVRAPDGRLSIIPDGPER
jgi:hypothetical protein